MRHLFILGTLTLLGACSKPAGMAASPGAGTGAPEAQAGVPAAAPAPSAQAAQAEPGLLSAGGVGAVRFGMTLAQAEQATGGKATLPTPLDPACSMVRFPALPKLRFMVENGVVTRADAEPGVANVLGIAVGDPLDTIRARHPDGVLTPHKYDANAHYLNFPGSDGRSAIVVEENSGKVTKVRAGLQPAVAYVETCG